MGRRCAEADVLETTLPQFLSRTGQQLTRSCRRMLSNGDTLRHGREERSDDDVSDDGTRKKSTATMTRSTSRKLGMYG